MKKVIALAATLTLILSLLVLPAHALDIDMDRKGSITATMVHNGEPVSGGTLTLYKVADMDPNGPELFVFVEDYEDCDVELDELNQETAIDLATYTYYNDIEGETKRIGADGVVKFEDLEPGLYLLIQWEAADGYYELFPFLVSIPSDKDGEYIYDVESVPKQDPIPEPTWPTCPTEPTEPSEPSEPTEPTEPSEPSEPTEPTEPSEPSEPTEPTEPSEPSEPTEPTEPSEPSVPTEPTKPSEPSEPTESTEPTTPEEPTEPDEPKLPQTGQTNWPVPFLSVTGAILLVSGLILMTQDKKHYDEA